MREWCGVCAVVVAVVRDSVPPDCHGQVVRLKRSQKKGLNRRLSACVVSVVSVVRCLSTCDQKGMSPSRRDLCDVFPQSGDTGRVFRKVTRHSQRFAERPHMPSI